MKIDILDTAMNSNGMSYFDLTERIETLEKAGAQIKDNKHISSYPDGRNFTTAILYEEPTIIQQQSFYTRGGGKEINQFLASHDVVKVDHTSADHGEIITTIVYRKVIKKVDPWGDNTSEDD